MNILFALYGLPGRQFEESKHLIRLIFKKNFPIKRPSAPLSIKFSKSGLNIHAFSAERSKRLSLESHCFVYVSAPRFKKLKAKQQS